MHGFPPVKSLPHPLGMVRYSPQVILCHKQLHQPVIRAISVVGVDEANVPQLVSFFLLLRTILRIETTTRLQLT